MRISDWSSDVCSSDLPRGVGRGGRPRRQPGRGRGPARSRRRRTGPFREPGLSRMSTPWPPLRAELCGIEPYGAPQLDLPVQLNVNENPYGPSPEVVADIASAVAVAASTLNRYPDREFSELRAGLADYLNTDGGNAITPEMVWAATGSNEVMLQLLQAFGGPGRTALSFAPTYSMYPEYARDSNTTWVVGHREDDFSLDLDHARDLIRQHRPHVVLLPSPNNPTGTALSPEVVGVLCEELGEEIGR